MRADKMPDSVFPTEGDFSCAAVVVAGGASRRLNHVPKASLSDGTSTLLDCALEAVAAASRALWWALRAYRCRPGVAHS